MIEARTFAGKTVAVFGMGLSGLAAGRSLLAGGATVLAWDDTEIGRGAAAAAGLPLADLGHADWTAIDSLVLAPGVPLTHPAAHWTVSLARRHGVEIIGDTEIFCRERRRSGTASKLIAITGTNGKSTTTALTGHLLAQAGADAVLGGNIGTAVLDLAPFADRRISVLELSSFQLDLTPSLDADAAALLNITPDHLDRHGSMENYAAVKAKVFHGLRPSATAVIGSEDSFTNAIADSLAKGCGVAGHGIIEGGATRQDLAIARISLDGPVEDGIYADGARLFEMRGGKATGTVSLEGIGSLRGRHNAQNAAAALALARSMGFSWARLTAALPFFPGLPHRMEEVRRIGGVLFINDSKATNAEAAGRALASFSRIYWIAGGKPKDGGIESLAPYFPRIEKAYLIGEAAEAFADTLRGKVAVKFCGTLDAAVAAAASDARIGANVSESPLLSRGEAEPRGGPGEGDGGAFDAITTHPGPIPKGEGAIDPLIVMPMMRDQAGGAVLLSPACASYDQFANFEARGAAFRDAVLALVPAASGERAA